MCDHLRWEMRRRTLSNGVVVATKQCIDCGAGFRSVPKNSVDIDRLPAFDDTLQDRVRAAEHEKWRESMNAKIAAANAERDAKNAQWWRDYNAYLLTDKWAAKRRAVLQRDKGICQACLSRPAKQCHHLTYAHVFDEPLFDLIAVCIPCHDKITKMDRERRNA